MGILSPSSPTQSSDSTGGRSSDARRRGSRKGSKILSGEGAGGVGSLLRRLSSKKRPSQQQQQATENNRPANTEHSAFSKATLDALPYIEDGSHDDGGVGGETLDAEHAIVPNDVFSESQLKGLRDTFNLFDIDKDGRISCAELRRALQRLLGARITDRDAQSMVADVDRNCNGTVEFNEFVGMMAAYHRRSRHSHHSAEEAEAVEAFQALDLNGDGYVDFGELQKAMHSLLGEPVAEDQVHSMMQEADADRDGRIDFKEFKQLMTLLKHSGVPPNMS